MPTKIALTALTIAALGWVAATPAHAEDAPRHSVGAAAWLHVRDTSSTIGLDLQGTYRPGSQHRVQVISGLGAARIGVGCDSGDICGANEARAFVGGAVVGCVGMLCATGGVAVVGRRHRQRSREPRDANYQAAAELRAALELGHTVRLRVGGRLETSTPSYNDQKSTMRPVLEVGVISTF